MPLLILPPQIIRRAQFPFGFFCAQVKHLYYFRVVRFHVKRKVPSHHALPNGLLHQIFLAHFVALQLMGHVNLPQKLFRRQLPLQILHPGQASVLTPDLVLFVVHGDQSITLIRRGILPAQESGVHSVPQLVADLECAVLVLHQVPFKPRAPLFAGKPIRHPVTVPGDFFRLGDEPAPAVVAPGNALLVLLEVEGQLQHPQSKY